MTFDIIVAGVGGQGVVSLSAIIASSAMREGLSVKQSEVHGMAQRGGVAEVAAVPGEAFGSPGYLRFSYATGKEEILLGIEGIKKALEKLK